MQHTVMKDKKKQVLHMLIISVPASTKKLLIKTRSITLSKSCQHLSRIQTVSSVEVLLLITRHAILAGDVSELLFTPTKRQIFHLLKCQCLKQ